MAVTIIVLLILAAVAINLTVGENGIFTRAQNATQKWQEAEVNEQKEMNGLVDWMDELSNKVTDENPGELSGEGTEQNPYLIQSIEDLVAFSAQSFNNTFANEYISLDLTLDFNSDSSYVDPNGKQFGDINGNSITEGLKTELTTGRGFPLIGKYLDFSGNFNGNNYSINNLYINSDYDDAGLFGYIENASVKNLTVSGNIESEGEYIGGIIGKARNSRIENCINDVAVEGNGDCVGGIVGMVSGSEVINCVNKANITGSHINSIGGIAGKIELSNITNSVNYGQISLTSIQDDSRIGGIAGLAGGSIIDNCFNYGKITCKANLDMLYKGDLIGQDSDVVQIKDNCKNNGIIEVIEDDSISYDVCVGGIIGGYVLPS